MPRDHNRILELALESLESKKTQLELEIAEINRELKRSGARRTPVPARKAKAAPAKKGARFSDAEKSRRSERMKEYWRKKKAGKA